ncbi:hypothetical protein ACOME3_001822 [Neoechinorhynchus agilis]
MLTNHESLKRRPNQQMNEIITFLRNLDMSDEDEIRYSSSFAYCCIQSDQSASSSNGVHNTNQSESSQNKTELCGVSDLNVMREIRAIAKQLQLPEFLTPVIKNTYHHARNIAKLAKERPVTILASCVLIGCRQEIVMRSFAKVSCATRVKVTELERCTKLLAVEIGQSMDPPELTNVVEKYSNRLELDPRTRVLFPRLRLAKSSLVISVKRFALHIANKAISIGIADHHKSQAVAAACIYMSSAALGKRKRYEELFDVSEVAISTIQSIYKELLIVSKEIYMNVAEKVPVAPHQLPYK